MDYRIVNRDCCAVGLTARNKDEALRRLADQAVISDLVKEYSADFIYHKLKDREEQGSTGFGSGMAIPHSRIEGMRDFLVFFVVFPRGVDFDSMDRKKVNLCFVILGPPERVNEHLQILASISQTLGNTTAKREILNARTAGAAYESYVRHSRLITGSGDGTDTTAPREMKLLTVILYMEDFLYHILELFIQEGIDGATIVESSGMGEYISNVPLFAEFIGFMQEKKYRSKTIMVLIPADRTEAIIRGIEEITGDLDKKQGAMIMTSDVSFYKGSMRMM